MLNFLRQVSLICVICFSMIPTVYCQNSNDRLIELGEEAYKANHYQSAIDYFQQAEVKAPSNAHIKYMLAECYRNSFRYTDAEENYQKVVSLGSVDDHPLLLFQLALTQKMNTRYDEAANTFDEFIKFAQAAAFPEREEYLEQAKTEKKGCLMAIDHSSIAFREFNLVNLPEPVNSRFNDYGAYPYRNDFTVVITSGREEAIGKKEDSGFDEDNTDCFRFVNDSNNWKTFSESDDFDKTNDSFHEGAGSFNSDFTKYYFTRCANSDCAIYFTQLQNGKWQPMVKLNDNINVKGTESKHPFVSITGDTLFFISNRPGGYGMNDVYMSINQGKDQWGVAANLGNEINTKHNEASPYYFSKEKIFCFSSQGHAGYGGLDIFTVHDLFTKPVVKNIGKPFNSNADDFYFVFGTKTGYLSSNRSGGKGKFDIYSFNITADESVIALLEDTRPALAGSAQNIGDILASVNTSKLDMADYGSVSGRLIDRTTGKVLKKIEVLLVNDKGEVFGATTTDENGFFNYDKVPLNKDYKVTVKRNSGTIPVKHELSVGDLTVDGYREEMLGSIKASKMDMADYGSISGRLVDRTTGKTLKQLEVLLMDERGEVVKTALTNEDGLFNYANVALHQNYKVNLKRKSDVIIDKHELGVADLMAEGYSNEILSSINTSKLDMADYGSVSGRLIDRTTGKALKKTEILLIDSKGEIFGTTTTDENGFFSYDKVPLNTDYKVTVKRNSSAVPPKHELSVGDLAVNGYKEETLGSVKASKMQMLNNASISGRIVDRTTGKALKQVEVLLIDEHGEIVKTVLTDEDGTFNYDKVSLQQNYNVRIKRNVGQAAAINEPSMIGLKVDEQKNESANIINTFNLEGYDDVSISGTLKDFATGKALKEAEVLLINDKGEVMKITSTNEDGFFRYTQIPFDQNYKVTVKRKSGLITDVQELGVMDLKVEGYNGKAITNKFESIYFDFDKADLRAEAIKTLDDLSDFCRNNTAIQIEIDAFTDFIGPDGYNNDLSLRRGNSAFNYLIKSGVDRSSIVVIPKGKQNPVALNETLEGRQRNRRVEFVIKGGEQFSQRVETYIIEAKMTLYSIAKKYSTTVEELMRLNGLQSTLIEAFRPLRVPIKKEPTLSMPIESSKVNVVVSNAVDIYKVKKGDTIFSIATSHNMTVEKFREMNGIKDNLILPGQIVKVKR